MLEHQPIPFNRPLLTGQESIYLQELYQLNKYSGDGAFTSRCNSLIKEKTNAQKVLLTTSCTHALELAAILFDVGPGDEVILPSFTFVSTANPFVLRGATILYVDVDPGTMNMDMVALENAITPKTKVVVPVHYAGVGCDMERLMKLSKENNFFVVEDAAQCIGALYQGKPLGTLGHLGAFSFHDTKNLHCGEGGALLINDETFIQRSEVIREKGTNRQMFLRGQVDKYTWVDVGSSYLPSELNAAFLLAQLEKEPEITERRRALWDRYFAALKPLQEAGKISLPTMPKDAWHNGHIFFIKCKDIQERQQLIEHLKAESIQSVFHYIPLHTSIKGEEAGTFVGEDIHTTKESERLLRLPMYFDLTVEEIDRISDSVFRFYHEK